MFIKLLSIYNQFKLLDFNKVALFILEIETELQNSSTILSEKSSELEKLKV
jgi:hypothetical protein